MINNFSFYKPEHNEDAEPLALVYPDGKSGFLIVADGLGGSGSFVHRLNEKLYKQIDELPTLALEDYYSKGKNIDLVESIDEWINVNYAPMIDKKPDTSALWGSRIVITRFAYYLLKNPDADFSDDEVKNDAIEYIYKGLRDVVDYFDLETNLLGNQLTLPTTLVASLFKEGEDGLHVDVIWAGDSRAFALIPGEGLKQLSIDDEDNSGSINNLFAIKNNKNVKTQLRFKRFVLPKKAALFVVSDGFFDPFTPIDDIGVEFTFLDSLKKAESFDELKQNWFEMFADTHHDDCSISFAVFGFDTFDEFKAAFVDKFDFINNLQEEYFNNKKVINVIKGNEQEPKDYIVERFMSRLPEISMAIASNYGNDNVKADTLVAPEVENALAACEKASKEKLLTIFKEKAKRIVEYVKFDYNRSELFTVSDELKKDHSELAAKIEKLIAKTQEISCAYNQKSENKDAMNDAQQALKQIEYQIESWKIKLNAKISEYNQRINKYNSVIDLNQTILADSKKIYGGGSLVEAESNSLDKFKKHKSYMDTYVENLKNLLTSLNKKEYKGFPKKNPYSSLPSEQKWDVEVKALLEKYNACKEEYDAKEKKVKTMESNITALKLEYENVIESAKDELAAAIPVASTFIKASKLNDFGLPINVSPSGFDVEVFAAEIEKRIGFKNNGVLAAFLKSAGPTVIDIVFNTSSLSLYRKIHGIDFEKIKALLVTIDEELPKYMDVSKFE